MDSAQAALASSLTAQFYEHEAASFSATRQQGWQGWELLLPYIAPLAKTRAAQGVPLRLIDLGCGNLRFETWLKGKLPQEAAFEALGVDRCLPLMAEGMGLEGVRTASFDLASLGPLPVEWQGNFDVAVCFGLIHHLPLASQRHALIERLSSLLAPGGVAVVACWRFMDDGRLSTKAQQVTLEARKRWPELVDSFGPKDWLLGWQGSTEVVRFCHHVDEEELDSLMGPVQERARFFADGSSGTLNRYVVFEPWLCTQA